MSMSNEQDNQDDFIQNDQHDAEGDAAFEAAFNSARASHAEGSTLDSTATATAPVEPGDGAPAEPDAAAAALAAAEAETAAAAKRAEEEANAPVTLTRAQLEQMHAKLARVETLEQQLQQTSQASQKVAGRIGSIQQTIDNLKTQASQGKPMSPKQLKRLQENFPELHDMLIEDFAEAFNAGAGDTPAAGANGQAGEQGGAGAAENIPSVPADPMQDPAVVKVLQAKEMAIVDAIHPGWRDMSKTPEFKEWRAGLPPAAQHLLATSWDSNILKDAISHFKADQEQRATAAQARAAATASASKQRDKRLENAMPATTGAPTGAHAVDEDAAFAEGFAKARGVR